MFEYRVSAAFVAAKIEEHRKDMRDVDGKTATDMLILAVVVETLQFLITKVASNAD